MNGIFSKVKEQFRSLSDRRAIDCLKRELKADREALPQPGGLGTCLIVSNSSWRYQAKIEGMLGMALRRAGWRVVVATQEQNQVEREIFRCFGLEEFLCSKSLNSEIPKAEVEEFLKSELAGCQTFDDIKRLRFREAWIGPQILSTVFRQLKASSLDVRDTETRRLLEATARNSLDGVFIGYKVFEVVRPNLLVTGEANYAFKGALVDIAVSRDIDVIHFNQVVRDNAILFKRLNRASRRTHPNSLGPATWKTVQEESWTPEKEAALEQEWAERYGNVRFIQNRDQPGVRHRTRAEICSQLEIEPGRKIVCVFSHVLWDTNLFFGEDLFADFSDWLWNTARIAGEVTTVDWVFKLHPANHWKSEMEGTGRESADLDLIRRALGGQIPSHIHFLEPRCGISTLSLAKALWAGITVRGTVGMELPCFGVPGITAGTGRYSSRGFTVDSGSVEEYTGVLRNIADLPRPTRDQVILAKKHVHAVFLRRLWKMSSFRSDFRSGYKKNAHFLWNLWRHRAANGDLEDLDAFSRWAMRTNLEDYLTD